MFPFMGLHCVYALPSRWRKESTMAKITVSGFMHYTRSKYDSQGRYTFFNFDASKGDADYLLIGPASFEYAVPDEFSPIGAALARLQAQRGQAAKQFSDTVRRIDEEIGKLTAITNEVAA